MGLQQESGCHMRRSTRIWLSFCIHRFLSSLVSALSQFLVTQSVSLHRLTRVSRSSSLCGLTVISSNVLGRAQNSRFAGSTLRLVQLARLMRPIGFFRFSSSGQVQQEMQYPERTHHLLCQAPKPLTSSNIVRKPLSSIREPTSHCIFRYTCPSKGQRKGTQRNKRQ